MAAWTGARRLVSTSAALGRKINPYSPTPRPWPILPHDAVAQVNTAEQETLKEKEKGSWKDLTIEEKKAIYRMTFPLTISEINASNGEWKYVLGGVMSFVSVGIFLSVITKQYFGPQPPYTYTKEWQELDRKARTPPTKIG